MTITRATIISSVFSLFLIVIPFVVLPVGNSPYESGKSVLVVLLALLGIILHIVFKKDDRWKHEHIVFLLGVVAVIFSTVLYSVTNPTPLRLFGNTFRFQGAIPFLSCCILGVLANWHSDLLRKIDVYVGCIGLIALDSWGLTFGFNESMRAIGPFGEPNAFAGYGVFLFLITYSRVSHVLKWLLIALIGILLFYTQSLSALLALCVSLLYFFLKQISVSRFSRLILVCILGFIPIYHVMNEPISSVDRRVDIWNISFHAIRHQPVFGYGFGGIETAIGNSVITQFPSYLRFYIDDPHNLVLLYLLAGGTVGLIGLLGLVLYSIYQSSDDTDDLVGMLVSLFFLLFYNPQSILLHAMFWIVLGSIAAPNIHLKRKKVKGK